MLSTFGAGFRNQRGNLLQLSWPRNNVDVGSSLKDDLLIFLSHAPHHADDLVRIVFLFGSQSPQRAVRFVFGLLSNTAGVEKNRIGVLDTIRQFIAFAAQAGDDHLAVQHVHLTANGFDVKFVRFDFGLGC